MKDKFRIPPLFVRILFILIAVLMVYLVVGFVRQVGVSQQRQDELRRLDQAVAVALDEQAVLEESREHAQSDVAVEEWARENGWAGPDEVLVVIVDPEENTSVNGQEPSGDGPGFDTPRDAWWDLFFGTR